MMDQSANPHLAYDDLLRTLTDPPDLSPEQQAHLNSCHRCRRQAEDLQYRYRRLGRMARKMAPAPTHTIRFSSDDRSDIRWYFKPGVIAGICGVLVFVFTMWWPHRPDSSDVPAPVAANDISADERLLAEVDALVEDAMPKSFQQVAVVSEPILSKDLIDWIVPSIDDDNDRIDPGA